MTFQPVKVGNNGFTAHLVMTKNLIVWHTLVAVPEKMISSGRCYVEMSKFSGTHEEDSSLLVWRKYSHYIKSWFLDPVFKGPIL